MEYAHKTTTFFLLKTIIYTVGFLSLLGMSGLWIGSNDNWNQMIENEFIPALIIRSIFLTVAGLLFLGLSSVVSKTYKKENRFLKELVVLLLFSFTLNLITMLGLI